MIRVYIFVALLAALGSLMGGAYLKGRADGKQVEYNAQIKKVQELNKELNDKEKELQALEQQRLADMQELEDQVEDLRRKADEDPNADRIAIGVDSVLRLNSVR